MTLIEEIQKVLERTYAPLPINLADCLISDCRCAMLTRRAGGHAVQLAPQGRTFLWRSGEGLRVAIFYSRPLIAELERNDPRHALNERNISPLITFIEEIAHGLQASLLYLEGERTIESEDFARNLETQARIDTYLVLSQWAHVLSGGKLTRKIGSWLRRQVFDQGHLRFRTPVLQERYAMARACGLAFIRHLRRVPMADRQATLRHFRALDWARKQAYLAIT